MHILVTGGTGLLGTRLIPHLVRNGHQVPALTRSATSAARLRALGAVPVIADLDSPGALALPPIDAVVHAAALFRFSGPREPFARVNVEGTARMLAAAERAGAKRFVHISAAGIIMDEAGTPIRNADERAPTHPHHFSAYLASKARAESLVLEADTSSMHTLALRPPALWGPGDPFSRALPKAISTGQFAFINRGEYAFDTCHVDNVIEAIDCALARGEGGRAYFITDREKLTFREFVALLAGIEGLSIEKLRSIPYGMASVLGRVMDAAWTLASRNDDPPLSRSMIRMIGREFSVNDGCAQRELGYVGTTTRAMGVRSYTPSAAEALAHRPASHAAVVRGHTRPGANVTSSGS